MKRSSMNHLRRAFASLLLLLVAYAPAQTITSQQTLWGGNHVELRLADKGGDLVFDCATGRFTEPLKPDSHGRFAVRGTFAPEHGGPVQRDEADSTQQVTYTGIIKDDTMTLEFTLAGVDEPRTFQLLRGQNGNIRKCR